MRACGSLPPATRKAPCATVRPQAAIAGKRPIATAGACLTRRRLERLGRDDDADPQHDRHPRLDRNQAADQAHRPREANGRHDQAVERRIAGPRRRLPAGMPDIDRRGKAAPKERGRDRRQPVDAERGRRAEAVTRRLGRLDVLQAAQDVEEAHRHDHRQIAGPFLRMVPHVPQQAPQLAPREMRQIEPVQAPRRFHRLDAHRLAGKCHGHQTRQHPRAQRAQEDRHESARQPQRKARPREIRDQNDRQRKHADQRPLVDLQGKLHRDKTDGDPRERRQQGGPRRAAADCFGDESAEELDQSASQARQHAGLPGRLGALGPLVDGQHHEIDVDQQRRRIDAEGEGRDVAASGGPRRNGPAPRKTRCR